MMRLLATLILGSILAVSAMAVPEGQHAQVPSHPRELKFAPLAYQPPEPSRYRRVLANKVVAYMVEDHDLPLVNVAVYLRAGSYLDPKGKEGLAAAVGSQIRAGGTTRLSPDQFDEEADFLAANISSSLGATSGSASVNFLAKDTDKALELFFEMLRQPGFRQDRFDLRKTQVLQDMERRNDETSDIEAREWSRLMRGAGHFSTAAPTKASIESLTREDLVRFHERYYHPGNFILAVSGDFKTAEMQARLEKAMADWPAQGDVPPPVPKPAFTPMPGLYLVHKPDVNQGRVSIGQLGIVRGNPDEIAVDVMNEILGGGFASRITNRVRSDEGLAYSAGSDFSAGIYYEGLFRASFQSRSESVAQAAHLVLEEIRRIRDEKVSADELDTIKNYSIEVFPRFFATAAAVASTFANDELTGRDARFWSTYRERVRAVTIEDVQRVAQKYLQPDKLVVLAVGNVDDMLEGNPDKPQFSLEKIASGGAVTRIPLPDPLTLEYPAK
jgi:predicted Zn-dependent peptidase